MLALDGISNIWQQVFLADDLTVPVVNAQEWLKLLSIDLLLLLDIVGFPNFLLNDLIHIYNIYQINMNKIYYVTIITFSIVISSAECSNSNYPNCVKALAEKQFSSTEINSNKNFISLAQFLIKLDTKTQNYFQNKANEHIQNGEISSQRVSEQSEYQYLMSYFIMFGISALFSFVLIFMRAKASYDKSFRKFVSKTMEIAITPSLVVASIAWVTFLFIFWSYIQQFPAYIGTVQCSQSYMKDLVLYGDNRSDWAGLYGFENIINSQIEYLETIQTIPTTYYFELLPIKNRRNQRMSYSNQFMQQYFNASISYPPDNSTPYSIKVRDLLPKLLSKYQNERTILNKLNESEKTLFTISDISIHIEAILNDLNITISKTKASLLKMIPSYKMPGSTIQKGNIFVPLLKSSDGKSSRSLYQLDRNYYLKLFSTVFIGVGLQIGISYVCFILFSLKIRYNLIIKLTNFLWILLICQFLLGIPIMFLYNTVITQVQFQCEIFDNFLTNRTTYYSYQKYKAPGSNNVFKILQPCLFESYDRYTKKTSIGNFTNFPDLQRETAGFINFHTNLSTLINLMDPGSSPFEYDQSINEAIQYIEDQKANNLNGWDYLNYLLDSVNNYTFHDILNSQCYNHVWQFSRDSCPKSMNILPAKDNNLIIPAGSFQNSSPSCLIFTSDLSQILSNYKLNQSRCKATFDQIQPLLLEIVQVLQTRDYVLNSIQADLQSEKDSLNEYLRILRTNYLLKKRMYEYVVTLERTIPFDQQSIKNWEYAGAQHNNCTCIKTWMDKIYNNTCINMRSDLLKTYLILLISQIFLVLLLIFGFMYGVNQEVKQIEHQEIDNDILSPSEERISHGELNAKPVQNKYINQFFSDSQKNQ